MNKLTVLDATPKERDGSFKNDKGENIEYSTRKQPARLEIGGFAYPYDVRLEDGQKPFPAGDYVLDLDAMLAVNKGVATISKFAVLRPAK
jgi:hypothetical protein